MYVVVRIFTAIACALMIVSGLLTVMMERYLYKRRGYHREAAVAAAIGWTYIIGAPLAYIAVQILKAWL